MVDETAGEEFGGALEELRLASRVNLPRLADSYLELANAVKAAAGYDHAFERHEYFIGDARGGPGFGDSAKGAFFAEWERFRVFVEEGLGATGNNFIEVAEVLDLVIERFVEEDAEAGRRLEELTTEFESGGDRLVEGDSGWKDEIDPTSLNEYTSTGFGPHDR